MDCVKYGCYYHAHVTGGWRLLEAGDSMAGRSLPLGLACPAGWPHRLNHRRREVSCSRAFMAQAHVALGHGMLALPVIATYGHTAITAIFGMVGMARLRLWAHLDCLGSQYQMATRADIAPPLPGPVGSSFDL